LCETLRETAKSHGRTPNARFAHVHVRRSHPPRTERAAARPVRRAGLSGLLAEAVDGHLATFAEHVREGLLATSTAVGLEVMAELMEAEVTDLAGAKGRHNPERTATRHGSEAGSVTLGGRRLAVQRPRVRGVGADTAEVPLESYRAFAGADLLADGIVARMLAGISTRRHPVALEPVGQAVEQAATSTSSAVSRRFVAATAERLAELCAHPLGEQRWPVVMLDGVHLGEHLLVVALGVTAEGTKVPLGVGRGLHGERRCVHPPGRRPRRPRPGRLRGRAVRRRRRQGAGEGDPVGARSQGADPALPTSQGTQHLEHLPERPLVQHRLRAAWAIEDASAAERALESIARSLARKRPGAAASLREGLGDTVTVNRLGVTGALLKTVESTNPVKSMIEIVRDHSRRVKRWQHGETALRWAAAGMLAAEAQFRRVKGYRQLPALLGALEAATAEEPGLPDLRGDAAAPAGDDIVAAV
jgi:transposase-like protein